MERVNKPQKHLQKSFIAKSIEKAKNSVKDDARQFIKFSFKYLTDANPKFDYNQYGQEYYLELLKRIKEVSKYRANEFRQKGGKVFRSHAIKWNEVSEDGFGLPEETDLVDMPWQFSLRTNNFGRVHGFWIGDYFFVVWLDKNHKLYN